VTDVGDVGLPRSLSNKKPADHWRGCGGWRRDKTHLSLVRIAIGYSRFQINEIRVNWKAAVDADCHSSDARSSQNAQRLIAGTRTVDRRRVDHYRVGASDVRSYKTLNRR